MLEQIQNLLREAYLEGFTCPYIASIIDSDNESLELVGLNILGCTTNGEAFKVSLNDLIIGLPNEKVTFLEALGFFPNDYEVRCMVWGNSLPEDRIVRFLEYVKTNR